jgi:excisionase family DNA binding protein
MNDASRDHDLISGADAARILNINRTTVYRWGQSGRLPVAVRLRRGFLFDRSDVEELARELEASRAKAAS